MRVHIFRLLDGGQSTLGFSEVLGTRRKTGVDDTRAVRRVKPVVWIRGAGNRGGRGRVISTDQRAAATVTESQDMRVTREVRARRR